MSDPSGWWADPRLVYMVAAVAVALLLVTVWLFRRRRRSGRPAAVVCLLLSIALHVALLWLVPLVASPQGGSSTSRSSSDAQAGVDAVSFSSFDTDATAADASGQASDAVLAPLPVADLLELLEPLPRETPAEPPAEDSAAEPPTQQIVEQVPQSLAEPLAQSEVDRAAMSQQIDSQLSELLAAPLASQPPAEASLPGVTDVTSVAQGVSTMPVSEAAVPAADVPTAPAVSATVPGALQNDFANRRGDAKHAALLRTGGSAETEAAVEAALRFLAGAQRPNGAWDPLSSGVRQERSPLEVTREGAGARAETAITGLALLTMMGAGHTHQQGEYADHVYRGLAYLIGVQKPDGSLAGNASVYAANYCHGMAALAMCEAAVITGDPSAVQSARRAIAHTLRMQHPTTGGWRYTAGDPGDLSQLGWQAMVLDAGHRAGIPIDSRAVAGVQRFLRSVRGGNQGGLASYRPREASSQSMTAEALATRLLLGEQVPAAEIAEAERYLLLKPPGVDQDNYYYWYYATLALHQLQDDAWTRWNEALKTRLLATQRSDGGWSSDTVWGGHGGTVYTTSMAALCLESYYRHVVRGDHTRIAAEPREQNPAETPAVR